MLATKGIFHQMDCRIFSSDGVNYRPNLCTEPGLLVGTSTDKVLRIGEKLELFIEFCGSHDANGIDERAHAREIKQLTSVSSLSCTLSAPTWLLTLVENHRNDTDRLCKLKRQCGEFTIMKGMRT